MAADITATLRLQVQEEVTTQFKRAREELENVRKQTERTKGEFKDLFKELAGPLANLGAGAAIGILIKETISAASSLEALESRAKVIFGDSFPQMEQAAAQFAQQVGRDKSEVL